MRALALRSLHAERGATFREERGAEVAVGYGDLAGEVAAARSRAVLVDRSERGRLAVTGADRTSFLHGQSSNDVASLRPGEGHYTTFLTGKGKMRGDAVLHAFPGHLLLSVEGDAAAAIRAHLEAFVIMEDVRIEDRSAATVELGVHGPRSREVLAKAGLEVPVELPEHHFVELPFAGGMVMAACERPTGEDGFELIAGLDLAPRLFAALAAAAPLAGFDALEVLRVEAGIPRFGQDLDHDTIPIEGGLLHAISYSKGCFTGQEVIARLKNYGHVNRNLVGLRLEGDDVARAGDPVESAGKRVGAVTSAVRSATLAAPIALAMVRREAAAPGTRIEVETDGVRHKGEVAALPFMTAAPPGRNG